MADAIRILLRGRDYDELVIGERFTIDGSDEVFAVHTPMHPDRSFNGPLWCASHVRTGHCFFRGDDIDFVIDMARKRWAEAGPEKIAAALAAANAFLAERDKPKKKGKRHG